MKISVQLRLTKKVISECFYSMGSIFWQHLVSSQPTVKLGSVQLQIKVFFMQGVCRVYKVLKDDESFFGGKSRSLKTISVLIPHLWGIKFCWFEALFGKLWEALFDYKENGVYLWWIISVWLSSIDSIAKTCFSITLLFPLVCVSYLANYHSIVWFSGPRFTRRLTGRCASTPNLSTQKRRSSTTRGSSTTWRCGRAVWVGQRGRGPTAARPLCVFRVAWWQPLIFFFFFFVRLDRRSGG